MSTFYIYLIDAASHSIRLVDELKEADNDIQSLLSFRHEVTDSIRHTLRAHINEDATLQYTLASESGTGRAFTEVPCIDKQLIWDKTLLLTTKTPDDMKASNIKFYNYVDNSLNTVNWNRELIPF